MISSKDAFLSSFGKQKIALPVPGTDETIELCALSTKDRIDYVEFFKSHENAPVYSLAFVICRACDFLSDEDIDTILDTLEEDVIAEYAGKVMEISGMLKESAEDAAKN